VGGSHRAISWAIVAVFAGLIAASGGYWWSGAGPESFCGDSAHSRMRSAIDDLSSVIPASGVTILDDCDSGGEVYAAWEVGDLDKMLANARAFGCRVDDRGFSDDEQQFLTCETSSIKVILFLDPWALEAWPASGGMQRAW